VGGQPSYFLVLVIFYFRIFLRSRAAAASGTAGTAYRLHHVISTTFYIVYMYIAIVNYLCS
jgi:hypothetical protein